MLIKQRIYFDEETWDLLHKTAKEYGAKNKKITASLIVRKCMNYCLMNGTFMEGLMSEILEQLSGDKK